MSLAYDFTNNVGIFGSPGPNKIYEACPISLLFLGDWTALQSFLTISISKSIPLIHIRLAPKFALPASGHRNVK